MTARTDLPVAVEITGPLGHEVVAYAETELGWQVVGVDGPPTPVVVLAEEVNRDRPTIVITASASPTDTSVLLEAGAVDVIAWPQERARLLTAPARVRGAVPAAPGPPAIRIAGAAGGVGTSTVALGLGAALAWAGRQVLVVGDDGLLALCGVPPWEGPGAVEVAGLDARDAGREVEALRLPVAGVGGLHVLGGGGLVRATSQWPGDVVVVDQGTRLSDQPHVVCARPDVGLRRVAGSPCRVLISGDGPLDRRSVRAGLGYEPIGWLPWSARVSRAAVAGRVPSGLPGTWMRQLRGVLAAEGGTSPASP